MNTMDFSEAMNNLDSKYVEKAIHYQARKGRLLWVRWGAAAACLLLVLSLFALPLFNTDSPQGYRPLLAITAYADDGTKTELSASSTFNSVTDSKVNGFGNEFPVFNILIGASKQYHTDRQFEFFYRYDVEVCYNGKVVPIISKDEHISIAYSVPAAGVEGPSQYVIMGWFAETTDIQVRLKEKDTGKVVETQNINIRYCEEENGYELTLTGIEFEEE